VSVHGGSDDMLVWKDARKGRSGMKVFQIMCECCGFCINVHTSGNEDGVKNVQVRYENRCPIMIFSQVCIPIFFPRSVSPYGHPPRHSTAVGASDCGLQMLAI